MEAVANYWAKGFRQQLDQLRGNTAPK
jgi:hypothetical protein